MQLGEKNASYTYVGRQRQIKLRRDVAKLGVVPFPLDRNELPAAGRDGFLGNLGTNDGIGLADFGGAEAGVLEEYLGNARPVVGRQPCPMVGGSVNVLLILRLGICLQLS